MDRRHGYMSCRNGAGISVVELLIALVIATLLLQQALPSLRYWLAKAKATRAVNDLSMTVSFARHYAILHHSHTVLCPLDSSLHCQQQWHQTLTLFADSNRNQTLDANEQVLSRIERIDQQTSVRTYPRDALRFDEHGYTGHYNGTLTHCVLAYPKLTGKIIVSRLGRTRIEKKPKQPPSTCAD